MKFDENNQAIKDRIIQMEKHLEMMEEKRREKAVSAALAAAVSPARKLALAIK